VVPVVEVAAVQEGLVGQMGEAKRVLVEPDGDQAASKGAI